jgi:hypothetical protein
MNFSSLKEQMQVQSAAAAKYDASTFHDYFHISTIISTIIFLRFHHYFHDNISKFPLLFPRLYFHISTIISTIAISIFPLFPHFHHYFYDNIFYISTIISIFPRLFPYFHGYFQDYFHIFYYFRTFSTMFATIISTFYSINSTVYVQTFTRIPPFLPRLPRLFL